MKSPPDSARSTSRARYVRDQQPRPSPRPSPVPSVRGNHVLVGPRARAEELLSIIDGWLPVAIDSAAVTVSDFALAGLVRCRRLLLGMVLLHDDPDLSGLAARALFETLLTTLFLVVGGEDAFDRLEANDDYEQRRIAKGLLRLSTSDAPMPEELRRSCEEVLARRAPKGKRINTADLAKELHKTLLAAGDPNALWPLHRYADLFAAESYSSVHGGIGAIKQHLFSRGTTAPQITSGPWMNPGRDHRLDLATATVLSVAHQIGISRGLPVSALDDLAQRWSCDAGWTEGARQDGQASEGSGSASRG